MSFLLIQLTGCLQPKKNRSIPRDRLNIYESDLYGTGKGVLYLDNPIILAQDKSISKPNFKELVSKDPIFVSKNKYLSHDCFFQQMTSPTSGYTKNVTDDCLLVLNFESPKIKPLKSNQGSWYFKVGSDEFYQVNNFFHVKKILDKYLDALKFSHASVHFKSSLTIPPATKSDLYLTKAYWFLPNANNDHSTLTSFAKCQVEQNSYFSSVDRHLCMGIDSSMPWFRMSQDPSVIYHEMGHAFVHMMINQRNIFFDSLLQTYDFHDYTSSLGTLFYDEAGSINEGIADYFSYMMVRRSRFGEWGMGRFYQASRPLHENDSLHQKGISKKSGERLKYPTFVNYDPNQKNKVFEDVHYAGQIISHYLVALTEKLTNVCSYQNLPAGFNTSRYDKQTISQYIVFMLLNEMLAYQGDLNGLGSDYNNTNKSFVNLNSSSSYLWSHQVLPLNYRTFGQLMGKNILHFVSTSLCPQLTQSESEELLDEYGLLLFKTYQDLGQSFDGTKNFTDQSGDPFLSLSLNAQGTMTWVDENNRNQSVLISKDLLNLPDVSDNRSRAFLFDGQSAMRNVLANLTFMGQPVQLSSGLADPAYNNGNIKISPGEVVGISLNLVNSSNSDMGGVQVLANDWDHMALANNADLTQNAIRPCIFNNWPLASENGLSNADCSSITMTNAPFIKTAGNYPTNFISPICLVQKNDENSTLWVSQDDYRQSEDLDLPDKDCLNNPSMSGSSFNPNECLVRVLPGAGQAFYSKIAAQKTWAETMKGSSNQSVLFNLNNIIVMEVNKWIPPGTKFTCRMRARFSNCADCFNDPDNADQDFETYDYAGGKPYQIIDFNFTVND